MLKVGLLCGVIAAMSATGLKANLQNHAEAKELDAKFIVELEDDIDSIDANKAIKQQDAMFCRIKHSVNANARKEQHFTLITNSLVISGNKEDKEAISNLKGVKSVTENGTHIVKKDEMGGRISFDIARGEQPSGTIDLSQNASAITMNKPDDTNDGEGTLIAVLDNEFYLRNATDTSSAFNHVTYTALDSSVNTRLNFSKMTNLVKSAKTLAQPNTKMSGKEGSLYFNSKVPFYYDYAGDSHTGSSRGAEPDYNVYSDIALHGSHVSSIAAGNDDNYKGIAPKAQLALMKVFTDVYSTPFSEAAKMGKYSSFSEIGFLNALEDAIKLKVDAINVSIGSDLSDFETNSIVMKTLSKLTNDAKILSAISAGNGGKAAYSFTGGYGNWTRDMVETGVMGSFANNKDTMTVASGQPVFTFYENSFAIGDNVVPYEDQIVNREGEEETYPNNEHRMIELISGSAEVDPDEQQQATEIGYVYVNGFGKDADYKNKDVEGKIAVVNRGSINFSDKYANAENAGAIGLIIVNNDPTANDFNFRCDFGGAQPSFPIALALFKDRVIFENQPEGVLKIKKNTASENKLANTVSDFSTDGATFDLDLKPEITSPGSNIKGAVTPQNKKENLPENKYSSYEYFNGTSMSAPNYEGAMATILSKDTKNLVTDKNGKFSTSDQAIIDKAKQTMNMRIMSTAIPMSDYEANTEDNKKTLTSPRQQGAGMVNIRDAYRTETYLEGKDIDGTKLNKAKILLRNNEDIAKGNIKLSFIVHNEANATRSYKVSYNVMRPATALNNTVLTADYHSPVEVDNVKDIVGFTYFSPEEEKLVVAEGQASYKDVIKITKDINYFENAEQLAADTPLGVFKEGFYFYDDKNVNSANGTHWFTVPNVTYQSIKDIEIAKVDAGTIEVGANETKEITLPTHTLSKEAKDKIQELYEFGTYIEGYVTLKSDNEASYPNLGIPYLGFYSLSDRVDGASYSTAPVVEPFSFEKDPTKIYGSDLINDVTKQLLGKDSVDYSSMMLAGYAAKTEDININRVLTNDESFKMAKGFHEVGSIPDPYKNELLENAKDNIYVGGPKSTNTLIIQQFVNRSVDTNYFTIVDKATNKEVYRSALQDMLFGEQNGKYSLYKSHVDADYLGAGYVAHRAYALVPLYDVHTKESFPSGEYELKFNYVLAGTGETVSKAYTLHIDSDAPLVTSFSDFKDGDKEMVRIKYEDTRAAYAIVGNSQVEVKYDEETNTYYSDVEKALIDSSIASSKQTSFSDKRLYVKVVDFAYNETIAVVHFSGDDYSEFEIAQSTGLSFNSDFKYENEKLSFIEVDALNNETALTVTDKVTFISGSARITTQNTGLIIGLSVGGGTLALSGIGAGLYFFLKKKKIK